MTAIITERYERLSRQFSDALDDVPSDAWSAASPCEGWDARGVLQHVVETNRDFLSRHFEIEPETGDARSDWEGVRAFTSAILADGRGDASFEGYFGPTTIAEVIDRFYGMDLLVHRWDIARAAGLREHQILDDADAAHYLEAARANGDALRMDGVCGPEVPAPADASTGERLLAFLGREPR